MRVVPVLVMFSGAAVAGYFLWPHWQHMFAASQTGTISPVTTAAAKASSVEAGAPLPLLSQEALGYGRAEGAALVAQLRATLQLLGIDPSWAEGLASADVSTYPDLMTKLWALTPGQRDYLEDFLLERWARLAPAEGLAYCKENHRASYELLLQHWAVIDYEAALSAVSKDASAEDLASVMEAKASGDPAGFMEWAKQHPEVSPLKSLSDDVALSRLATEDPLTVQKWLDDLPVKEWPEGGSLRGGSQFMLKLGHALMKSAPEDALAWISALPYTGAKDAALMGAMESLAADNPQQALELAKQIKEGLSRTSKVALDGIMQKLGWDDPATGSTALGALPEGAVKNAIMTRLTGSLLKTDPAQAFKIVEAHGSELSSIQIQDVPANSAEAQRWVDAARGAGDTTFRREVLLSGMMGWLQRDAVGLGVYLKGKMDEPAFAAMQGEMQRGLASFTGDFGLALPTELTDAVGLRPELIIIASLINDPVKATSELAAVTDATVRQSLVHDITQRWILRDRPEALEWSTSLTQPKEQAAAWKVIAADWLSEDSHGASKWISSLPPGEPRDAAVLSMATHIQDTDPDLSWNWALTMVNPELRQQALREAAAAWAKKDGDALRQALKHGNISADERQGIIETLSRP